MSAENTDTVTEQERVEAVLNHLWEQGGLYYVKYEPPEPEPSRARNRAVEEAMKALADPADRDESERGHHEGMVTALNLIHEAMSRAERAEAEVAELRATVAARDALIRDLADPDPCWFDHHGGCQAHGFLLLQPGQACPQHYAQQIVAALDGAGESDGE